MSSRFPINWSVDVQLPDGDNITMDPDNAIGYLNYVCRLLIASGQIELMLSIDESRWEHIRWWPRKNYDAKNPMVVDLPTEIKFNLFGSISEIRRARNRALKQHLSSQRAMDNRFEPLVIDELYRQLQLEAKRKLAEVYSRFRTVDIWLKNKVRMTIFRHYNQSPVMALGNPRTLVRLPYHKHSDLGSRARFRGRRYVGYAQPNEIYRISYDALYLSKDLVDMIVRYLLGE